MINPVKYSDFSVNLDIHPVKGDLVLLTDEKSISRSLKNLVFTATYERFWHPEKGAGIPQTLFELMGSDTQYILENKIKEVCQNYEPRAEILRVGIYPDMDRNSYRCTIVYRPLNSLTPETVDFLLKRIR